MAYIHVQPKLKNNPQWDAKICCTLRQPQQKYEKCITPLCKGKHVQKVMVAGVIDIWLCIMQHNAWPTFTDSKRRIHHLSSGWGVLKAGAHYLFPCVVVIISVVAVPHASFTRIGPKIKQEIII